jgi:transcriptional regulator with XRE-family HTH domain
MKWTDIRSAFIRARGGRSQATIGKAGGLRQNAISKIETNDKLGPAVETFINAVQGLGIPVSAFFAQVEQQTASKETRKAVNWMAVAPPAVHAQGRQHSPPSSLSAQERAAILYDIGAAITVAIADAAERVADAPEPPASARPHTTTKIPIDPRHRRADGSRHQTVKKGKAS